MTPRLNCTALLIPAFSAILLLTGCAMPERIVPQQTSAQELQLRLGPPASKRAATGGGEAWDYVYGPEGIQTWRFTLDSRGMVVAATPLLTVERLNRLVPGESTEQDVLEMLGKPRDSGRVGGEMTWEWRVHMQPQLGVFVVRFGDNGRVSGYNILPDVLIDGGSPGP